MSKYTTEVRYICEEAAGLDESVGYNDVERVVQTAYPKIFSSSLEFYNDETKARLLPKILIHYYQREIAFETVGLWKLKINQKLREILPYYNQLYASEALEYDPLKNVDNTHTHEGDYTDNRGGSNTKVDNTTETRNLTTVDDGRTSYDHNEDTILRHDKTTTRGNDTVQRGNDSVARTVQNGGDKWTLFSDTPQGGINGVQNAGGTSQSGTLSDNAYLTTATHETETPAQTTDTTSYGNVTNTFGNVVESYNKDGDKADHIDSDGWDKLDNTNTQTGTITHTGTTTNQRAEEDTGNDAYENHETGKIGVMTYQEMQMKWRESFLNIDMQIIDELNDLFMKVW